MNSDIVDLHKLRKDMEKAIDALKWNYTHNVVSRISPSVLEQVQVDFNHKRLPLKELGQVSLSTFHL